MGPGRAHVLSEEGCRVGPGPAGPGTLARALAALLAERVGLARARAHVRYRFFGCIYIHICMHICDYINLYNFIYGHMFIC